MIFRTAGRTLSAVTSLAWLVAALAATAPSARADDARAAPSEGTPRPLACARPTAFDRADAVVDPYLPAVGIGPSRAMHTALVMPPVPWLLTDGEAGTPACGRVSFQLSRTSDERAFTDRFANTFRFDGELETATLEVVSPRLRVDLFGRSVDLHVAGALSETRLAYAWFAGLRNVVEDVLGSADAGIRAAHDDLGRELSVTDGAGASDDLLGSSPMWRARIAAKLPLRDVSLFGRRVSSAWSVAATSPAFGSDARSGASRVQPETTLAWAAPLSDRWRLTGAFDVVLPGPARALESRGIEHRALVAGGVVSLEYWLSPTFAVALGATVNGPYTRDSSAPTDLASFYLDLGLLWRPSASTELHVLFAENPGNRIATDGTPSTEYSFFTQRDADFSLTFGGSLAF